MLNESANVGFISVGGAIGCEVAADIKLRVPSATLVLHALFCFDQLYVSFGYY